MLSDRQYANGGFSYKKSLGQNFIYDDVILTRIVELSGISSKDNVLEIGAGMGTLTNALAKKANKVTALETDTRLIPSLKALFESFPHVHIIHGDALGDALYHAARLLGVPISVVANIPYHITTPLLTRLLSGGFSMNRIVVMVQKEAADRLCALPGDKSYGMLSIRCRLFSDPRIVLHVPREWFTPIPHVDSVVVMMEKRETPVITIRDEAVFFRVCQAMFLARRKTILNNITAAFHLDRNTAQWVVKTAGIDSHERGENLSLSQMASLSEAVSHVS